MITYPYYKDNCVRDALTRRIGTHIEALGKDQRKVVPLRDDVLKAAIDAQRKIPDLLVNAPYRERNTRHLLLPYPEKNPLVMIKLEDQPHLCDDLSREARTMAYFLRDRYVEDHVPIVLSAQEDFYGNAMITYYEPNATIEDDAFSQSVLPTGTLSEVLLSPSLKVKQIFNLLDKAATAAAFLTVGCSYHAHHHPNAIPTVAYQPKKRLKTIVDRMYSLGDTSREKKQLLQHMLALDAKTRRTSKNIFKVKSMFPKDSCPTYLHTVPGDGHVENYYVGTQGRRFDLEKLTRGGSIEQGLSYLIASIIPNLDYRHITYSLQSFDRWLYEDKNAVIRSTGQLVCMKQLTETYVSQLYNACGQREWDLQIKQTDTETISENMVATTLLSMIELFTVRLSRANIHRAYGKVSDPDFYNRFYNQRLRNDQWNRALSFFGFLHQCTESDRKIIKQTAESFLAFSEKSGLSPIIQRLDASRPITPVPFPITFK